MFAAACVLPGALALAVGTALAAAVAGAGVKGRVAGWEKLVPQVYSEAAKSASRRYNWRESSPTVKQEFQKLSANVSRDVCVAALAATGAEGHEHEPMSIKLTGGRITPSSVVLYPGSRLSFKNFDPFPHVLYEAASKEWTANPVGPGSTREWSAKSPGLHVIRDELFPSVVMYVVIDPAAVEYAIPDRDGGFAMPLEQGDFTLEAFFQGKPVSRPVSVHVGGGLVELKEPLALGGGEPK